MAREHKSPLARLHALWTLHGLGQLDEATTLALAKDKDARIRVAAVRAMDAEIHLERLAAMADDPIPQVVAQVILTAG